MNVNPVRIPVDALIVGAGPAGSTAAILLAQAGWRVALVERQAFPRRKVCGECIAATNLPLLEVLGIAPALQACAGPELRAVTLLHGQRSTTAAMPAAPQANAAWGRALGRETLDALLLQRARDAGALVLQPWSVQGIEGVPGAWHCEARAADAPMLQRLRAAVVIDAHGSWEALPSRRPQRAPARAASDLFAFKANFAETQLAPGAIHVLALNGGYGGMVVADGGVTTVACCVRRDRLSSLRGGAPGLRAGDAVQAWMEDECSGVRQSLQGASRRGAWLAAGPLDTGARISAGDEMFRIGNAAGEAHPIVGEGLSMALQSAALLCSHLLSHQAEQAVPGAALQAELQRRYAEDWQRQFAPRLRWAAAFAHAAMRPAPASALLSLAQVWPGLLTRAAGWAGKVRPVELVAAA